MTTPEITHDLNFVSGLGFAKNVGKCGRGQNGTRGGLLMYVANSSGVRNFCSHINSVGLVIIFALTALVPSLAYGKAFPGAIGFGANTSGGRGGKVLKVTNLQDSGTGSLRWAVEQTGKRYVIFRVGGIINLKSQLIVKNPGITIAGQTAPGDGITLRGAKLYIVTDEVIVRGLRFRPGDADGGDPDFSNRDGISIGTMSKVTQNVIVDHNSMSWSTDELTSVWGKPRNVTISNNLMGEALLSSRHPKGDHSMGMIVGTSDDSAHKFYGPENITVARNLFANSQFRCPLIKNAKKVEFINNFCFNFKHFVEGGGPGSVHFIKNYFQIGTATSSARRPIHLMSESWSNYYTKDNLDSNYRRSSSQAETDIVSGSTSRLFKSPVFTSSGTPELAAADVFEYLRSNAGARAPRLDNTDARILQDVVNKRYRLVNSVNEAGGYQVASGGVADKDSDGDGMPDWFEVKAGLNNSLDDANLDKDRDGYTNIEEYFNSLISDDGSGSTEKPPAGNFKVEAESMNLSGFVSAQSTIASAGRYIQANSSNRAIASVRFPGSSGKYRIKLGYFDESDGISQMTLRVNGVAITTFKWNQNLGSANASQKTFVERVLSTMSLSTGDLVELSGLPGAGEPLRTDYLLFEPQ